MSKRICGLLFLVFLAGTMFAQTPFDGTWIANLDTAKLSTKPHVYLLGKGMFQCFSCVPKIDVKADGEDQKVMGSHYIDAVTIRVVDDRTVEETDKREGKTVLTMTRTVSYESTPDGLKMSDTNGVSYDAKFDGKSYLTVGDPGHTMVTLQRLDPNTIDETDKRDGKIVGNVAHGGFTGRQVDEDCIHRQRARDNQQVRAREEVISRWFEGWTRVMGRVRSSSGFVARPRTNRFLPCQGSGAGCARGPVSSPTPAQAVPIP